MQPRPLSDSAVVGFGGCVRVDAVHRTHLIPSRSAVDTAGTVQTAFVPRTALFPVSDPAQDTAHSVVSLALTVGHPTDRAPYGGVAVASLPVDRHASVSRSTRQLLEALRVASRRSNCRSSGRTELLEFFLEAFALIPMHPPPRIGIAAALELGDARLHAFTAGTGRADEIAGLHADTCDRISSTIAVTHSATVSWRGL